jgi:hypothetical protein
MAGKTPKQRGNGGKTPKQRGNGGKTPKQRGNGGKTPKAPILHFATGLLKLLNFAPQSDPITTDLCTYIIPIHT